MPGCSGELVVTTSCAYFHFARETAGASCARHSPRPLRAERPSTTRAQSRPRERGGVSHCSSPLRKQGPRATGVGVARSNRTESLNADDMEYGSERARDVSLDHETIATSSHNSRALLNENEETRRVFSSRIKVRVIGGSARWLQFSRSQSRQLTPIGVPSAFSRSIPVA
jgi:hypothetical protein